MSTVAQSSSLIAPHRFAFGYHRQTWWNWRIGAAFFCGEIGAGLFLLALLTGHVTGLMAGFLIVIVGKNTAHLLYLGRPARAASGRQGSSGLRERCRWQHARRSSRFQRR